MRRLVLSVLSLAFLAACQSGVAPLTDEDIAALNDVRTAYVEGVLANDCEAIAATGTQSMVSMPPNQPMIEGRAAYMDWCEARTSATPQAFTTTSLGMDGYGDLAFDRGTWSQTFVSEDAEPVTVTGKYLVIARKQPDDSWLWIAGIYNFDAPLPQPEQP
ncbi:MAG: hypothetical protein AMS18_13425 [Gemmatimonas sp. SG8_17]|nr:MAG: hypothetical protein AMS18_13425 [Gemmatimonas sp. SG8_17]